MQLQQPRKEYSPQRVHHGLTGSGKKRKDLDHGVKVRHKDSFSESTTLVRQKLAADCSGLMAAACSLPCLVIS